MEQQGRPVSISRLCRILGVPRSTFYYRRRPRRRSAVDEGLAARIKQIIRTNPAYGIRKVWAVLRYRLGILVNRKKVARLMRLKGWTLKQRRVGHRPRDRAWPSVAERSNQRWATDMTHIFCGRDGWCHLVAVMDCCDREVIGWRISRSGRSHVAEAALEDALISRFGPGPQAPKDLVLRSDNGLVFRSRSYRATVRDYGLGQEFTTPYTPEQNGMIERLFRSLKQECVWQFNFRDLGHAEREIGRWIEKYNTERPHEALGWLTPAEARSRQLEQAA